MMLELEFSNQWLDQIFVFLIVKESHQSWLLAPCPFISDSFGQMGENMQIFANVFFSILDEKLGPLLSFFIHFRCM